MSRHWKQHFDPDADYVFSRPMKVGLDPENPNVIPGDDVPKELCDRNRLQLWFNAGFIEIKDWQTLQDKEAGIKPAPSFQGSVVSRGRGWFSVTFPDRSSKNIRGQQKAEEALALACV